MPRFTDRRATNNRGWTSISTGNQPSGVRAMASACSLGLDPAYDTGFFVDEIARATLENPYRLLDATCSRCTLVSSFLQMSRVTGREIDFSRAYWVLGVPGSVYDGKVTCARTAHAARRPTRDEVSTQCPHFRSNLPA